MRSIIALIIVVAIGLFIYNATKNTSQQDVTNSINSTVNNVGNAIK